MNHSHDAVAYSRRIDAAKTRAHQLRTEAIADCRHEAGLAVRRTLRAANRLAHSLARHAHLRQQQGA